VVVPVPDEEQQANHLQMPPEAAVRQAVEDVVVMAEVAQPLRPRRRLSHRSICG
jgi:hypothetical protein